ncbi:MAG: polyketide cyclase [Actinomycetota bacterium]|nr:polyketide cyclase [Actinomycetota bacterium]MDP2287380.1 polyketide cyclase [Actinomycetota bacterium]
MSEATRMTVTRVIPASAEVIFSLVTLPSGHVAMDGSGMLISAPDDKPLTAVGDTFIINMDREPLGDVPEMGKYDVLNTVTAIEPNRLLEWSVGTVGRPAFGHFYGISLTPISDSETEVANYVDWAAIPEKYRDRVTFPVVPQHMMEASLARLEQALLSA